MMGHINNLLVEMVRSHHGAEGVDRLFELAGVSECTYKTEVVYPEEEFQALYRAAKDLYGVDDDAAQKAFSDYFLQASPKLFPAIFEELVAQTKQADKPFGYLCAMINIAINSARNAKEELKSVVQLHVQEKELEIAKRRQVEDLVEQMRLGQVDAIVGGRGESQIIRLMDQQLVEENERLVQELSRSNNELNDFSHVASHDLRAPLRHIRSFTKMLLEDETNQLSEDSKSFLHYIDKGGANMRTCSTVSSHLPG